jgi:hypothetical protein
VAPPTQPQPSNDVQIPDPHKTQPSLKPFAQTAEETARSIPKQTWADLAAGFRPTSIEPIAEEPKLSPVHLAQDAAVPAAGAHPAPTNSAAAVSNPLAQSAEETARSIPKQDWADLGASFQPKPIEPAAEKQKSAADPVAQTSDLAAANAQPASANSATPASPDPALVEAVVQRILDKMRPQVVDIITKEFLRPIVQALVHREILKH